MARAKANKKSKRRTKKNGGNFGALIPPALLLGTRQFLLRNKSRRNKTSKRYRK